MAFGRDRSAPCDLASRRLRIRCASQHEASNETRPDHFCFTRHLAPTDSKVEGSIFDGHLFLEQLGMVLLVFLRTQMVFASSWFACRNRSRGGQIKGRTLAGHWRIDAVLAVATSNNITGIATT